MTCPCENASYDGYCYNKEECKKCKSNINEEDDKDEEANK